MGDIIEDEEIDRDTVDSDTLEQLFPKKFNIITEQQVSISNSYVNKLSATKSLKLAVSLSDNSIECFEVNNASLSRVCRLSGHKQVLTELVCSPTEEHLLYSSGEDGVIKLWDTRLHGTCVQEYTDEVTRPLECMDVSSDGRVLCAGSQVVEEDAYLVFWDARAPRPLGGYWESHTDNITQVKFHKTKREILVTGALDGLLNVFNILEQTEDDALTYSLNVEKSVDKLCWVDETRVACITECNELQLWDAAAGDLLRAYPRDKIARSIKRSRPDDCYAVHCAPAAAPQLLAGSLAPGGVLRSVTLADRRLQPGARFEHNSQLVRAAHHCPQRDLWITAGEGGKITVWGETKAGSAGGAAAPPRAHAHRHRPY